jgi:large subunit ribosomal protein L7Ae
MAPTVTKGKKVAPAPLAAKKATATTVKPVIKNPLFEKHPRNFSIGCDVQPKRNLSRYIKWPVYIRIQRQKAILTKRLKVPPAINQFSKVLDKNTATLTFRLFNKYQPETKTQKKERRLAQAQEMVAATTSEGGDKHKKHLSPSKKPYAVKYGINHITALVEAKRAQLVLIADDVDPLELVLWLPALCRKMDVPYAIVKGKARLGTVVHKKTATALAITEVRPDDKHALATLVSAIRSNYNDRFDEMRKQWGGGILGFKSNKAAEKRRIATEKAIESRL